MNTLSIMHVWDQAGVACLLAKHHRTQGHIIDIYKRSGYDPFGILGFYNESEIDMEGSEFLNFVTEKSSNYDIIHIHSIPSLAPKIKKKYKDKKIVLHYHGSDLRTKSNNEIRKYNQYADYIILATIDLLKYLPDAKYIPNPIDTDHFVYEKRDIEKTFSIYSDLEFPKKSEKLLKSNGFDLKINYINRLKNPIQYSKMPSFMQEFGTYLDLRFYNNKLIKSYSKTALECLALGLRVLGPSFRFEENLPESHYSKNAADKVMSIYNNLIANT